MNNLEIIDSIKLNLEKENNTYKYEMKKLVESDQFFVSAVYDFIVKRNKVDSSDIRTLQTKLVRQFSSFMGLSDGIFSIMNMDENVVLSKNPYLKIGPFQKDSYCILLSDSCEGDISCKIITKPFNTLDFVAINSKILDFIAQPNFYTDKSTQLKLRLMHPDLKIGLDPLAFALNLQDQNILEKFQNKYGASNGTPWARLFMSEAIMRNFIIEDYCFNETDGIEDYKDILSSIADEMISEDSYSFSRFDTDKKYIDFFHMGGENYEYGILCIMESIFSIFNAFKASLSMPSQSVWNDIFMREKLMKYIGEINEVKINLSNFQLKETKGADYPCYDIMCNSEEFKIGSIHMINGNFENSIVMVGGISEFCLHKEEVLVSAAILSKRY